MEKPATVYWSVLESGTTALLNFSSRPSSVRLSNSRSVKIAPYEMAI